LLTCVKFHGKKIDNNYMYILTHPNPSLLLPGDCQVIIEKAWGMSGNNGEWLRIVR
jgi:hypothetical protein